MNLVVKKNPRKFQHDVIGISNNLSQLSNKKAKGSRQKSVERVVVKKKIKIYKNGDNSFEGFEVIISIDEFKSVQAFLDVISEKIGLKNGAKKLYTLNGEIIQSMDQIDNNKEYVAAVNVFTPLLYGQMNFKTTTDRISTKNFEKASSALTKKAIASRISRSVDLKKDGRKECTLQKKSKSQNRLSLRDITSKDKTTKTTKVIKEKSTVAIATVSNLSQSTEETAAKFASTSSKSSSAPTTKRSETRKITVKINPTPSMIPGGSLKHSLLSTGQRPSTTSIKNRTPTPKPGARSLPHR